MLLYAVRPNPRELLDGLAGMLTWILPVIGVYGIYQYVDPPLWDRFWLAMASIKSAGTPEAFEVRTFSTMHAPAAFATFTAMGLLVVMFVRRVSLMSILVVPAAIALLLSLYRTAWLSLIVSVIFCLFIAKTRSKAATAVTAAIIIVMGAITLVPFSDVITSRLETISDITIDPSGQERVGQFFALFGRSDSSLWGNGFSAVDVGVAGAEAVDGMLIACWTSMGIVVGLIHLAALDHSHSHGYFQGIIGGDGPWGRSGRRDCRIFCAASFSRHYRVGGTRVSVLYVFNAGAMRRFGTHACPLAQQVRCLPPASSRPARLIALLAGGAMLSKALGFVREVAMAQTFGASVIADSFRGSVTAVLLPVGPLLNESTPAVLIPMCRGLGTGRSRRP